ncbi:MAG: UDP-N-acetylmuramoyl-tripeptide--D-alanyl-D-alanine ligase [Clostridiales bacterium]|nr:UDP-N-acetylmuramoyl-tripeptide--D-alanyl-D-alanine ligase [Clostridiales bacterium]
MERITLREIVEYCSAHPCEVDLKTVIEGISIDSRSLKQGELFIPIIGEKFNGHNFIDKAREAGAVAVLSAQRGSDPGTLYVDDTLQALLDIARGYRKRFSTRITAITGSSGKTTTKEMCAAVLSEFMPTLKTEGNLNNLVGLPLSVLRLGSGHRAAVFEMGMNRFGEISRMTRAALPDISVITNIGTAHIEHLGSQKGILKAKTEIFEGLPPDGVVILNGDDPLLWELKGKLPHKTVFFGISNKDCEITAGNILQTRDGMCFSVSSPYGDLEVDLPAIGKHNVLNALAAIAVGLEYADNDRTEVQEVFNLIKEGLSCYRCADMRQNIISKSGVTIIDDCYNANPDSMSAALGVLSSYPSSGKKIAVLGDMLELGDYSEQAHRALGEEAAKCSDNILLIGTASENTLLGAIQIGKLTSQIAHFEDIEELSRELISITSKGDVILIKGSRGMRLEQVRDALIESLDSGLENKEQGEIGQ